MPRQNWRAFTEKHILGVYHDDNPQIRSLKRQLDLIQTKPFVRVAVVTIRPVGSSLGAYRNVQREVDSANEVYQRECGAWVYCAGSIVVNTNILGRGGILDQNGCPLGVQPNPTAEENALFNFGRGMGADVVGYYIGGSTSPSNGCSAFPAGRRGFWVRFNANQWVFAHELTHVIGRNPHPENDPDVPDGDQDNLMWNTSGAITSPPPDLRNVQFNRILADQSMETCG